MDPQPHTFTADLGCLRVGVLPIASMAVATFAVYIPPHAPAPGIAHDTIVCRSSSVIVQREMLNLEGGYNIKLFFCTADVATACPKYAVNHNSGLINRPIAMTQLGIFLSHSGKVTSPSIPSSHDGFNESAIRSWLEENKTCHRSP